MMKLLFSVTASTSALSQSANSAVLSMIKMMVGREMTNLFPSKDTDYGDVLLEVKNLNNGSKVKDISFQLHKAKSSASPVSLAPAVSGDHAFDFPDLIHVSPRDILRRSANQNPLCTVMPLSTICNGDRKP